MPTIVLHVKIVATSNQEEGGVMSRCTHAKLASALSFVSALLFTPFLPADDFKIEAGDELRVMRSCPLMIGRTKAADVQAGTKVIATDVRGDWVGVTVGEGGQAVRGWINTRFFLPISDMLGGGIQAGDEIITISSAPIMDGPTKRLEAEAGVHLKATHVSGPWVAVQVEKDSQAVTGWVHSIFLIKPPINERWIAADEPNVSAEDIDSCCWWHQFNDPVLNELVRIAYQQSRSLKIAKLRILESRAMRRVAASKSPIDIKAAQANLNAQIERYNEILVSLQAEVALNYIQLRSREELLDWLAMAVDFQHTQFRVVEKKAETGAANELELQEAQSLIQSTKAFARIFEREYRQAQNALSVLLGMPPQDLRKELGSPGTVPLAPPDIVVGTPANLIRRRPDVRCAMWEAVAQCAQIDIEESGFYPQAFVTDGLLARGCHGQVLRNLSADKARFLQAVVHYEQTVLQACEEVENAIVAFRQEQARLRLLEQARQSLERLLKFRLVQYYAGAISSGGLFATQRELVDLMIGQGRFGGGAGGGLIQTRANIPCAIIRVYRALAGGWDMRYLPRKALQRAVPPYSVEQPPNPEEPMLMGPPLPQ
jgi:outer membrane protein TolC